MAIEERKGKLYVYHKRREGSRVVVEAGHHSHD